MTAPVAGSEGSEEDGKRRELARETYGEVLDATKHQDDKIGRFLAGIAFLTSGAIAFGFRGEILLIHYRVGSGHVPYPALAFSVFALLVLLGVLLLIVSLGPNLSLPKGPPKRSDSRVFFLAIADHTPEAWSRRWSPDKSLEEIERELTRNYVDEALNISKKTVFKFHRTGEARAVLSLGILALALGIITAINAWSDVGVVDGSIDLTGLQDVSWALRPRLLCAVAISLFVAVLGYDFYRLEQSLKEAGEAERRRGLGLPVGALGAFPPVVLLAPVEIGPAGIAGVVLLGLAAWTVKDRFDRPVAVAGAVAAATLAVGTVWVFWGQLVEWQLLVAAGPAGLVEVPRLMNASAAWSRRRRAVAGGI